MITSCSWTPKNIALKKIREIIFKSVPLPKIIYRKSAVYLTKSPINRVPLIHQLWTKLSWTKLFHTTSILFIECHRKWQNDQSLKFKLFWSCTYWKFSLPLPSKEKKFGYITSNLSAGLTVIVTKFKFVKWSWSGNLSRV